MTTKKQALPVLRRSGICEPVSIATGIISGISAIGGTVAGMYQEKEAIEAQNRANVHNANMVIEEANDLSRQEGLQQQQERKQAAEQGFKAKINNMQQAATAEAGSESEGLAARLTSNEYSRMLAQDNSLMQANLRMQESQHNMARSVYMKSAKNQIAGLKDIKQSNAAARWAGTALDIGSIAMGSTASGMQRTKV